MKIIKIGSILNIGTIPLMVAINIFYNRIGITKCYHTKYICTEKIDPLQKQMYNENTNWAMNPKTNFILSFWIKKKRRSWLERFFASIIRLN